MTEAVSEQLTLQLQPVTLNMATLHTRFQDFKKGLHPPNKKQKTKLSDTEELEQTKFGKALGQPNG